MVNRKMTGIPGTQLNYYNLQLKVKYCSTHDYSKCLQFSIFCARNLDDYLRHKQPYCTHLEDKQDPSLKAHLRCQKLAYHV